MTSTVQHFHPTSASKRIDMLDAIRGFALFGILLMNLEAFNGPIMQSMTGIDPSLRGADRIADAFIYIFVQGKFWTLFSLLFGSGFAIMQDSAARSNQDFRRIYKRRLWALLAIGAAHAILVWEGDILFSYAVAGFVLLWRMKSDVPPRLSRILMVYCAPLVLLAFAGAMAGNHDDSGNFPRNDGRGSPLSRPQRFSGDPAMACRLFSSESWQSSHSATDGRRRVCTWRKTSSSGLVPSGNVRG
jgi:uncharacterized membrane protein YeiB